MNRKEEHADDWNLPPVTLRKHLELLVYSFLTWLTFFLLGLPDYYQSWPFVGKVVLVFAVTWLYFPVTRYTLKRFWQDGRHRRNARWLALYLTLPLFIYDYLLLAVYQELGIGFVVPYFYLTFFYFSFWIQFPWIAARMEREAQEVERPGDEQVQDLSP